MPVFLLVLKIIGIIAAVIVCLVFFALMTSVRYKAEIKYHEKLTVNAVSTWMYGAIRACFTYVQGGDYQVEVKLLFFTVFSMKGADKKKKRRKPNRKKNRPAALTDKKVSSDRTGDTVEESDYYYDKINRLEQKKENIFVRIWNKIVAFFEGAADKFRAIKEKTDVLKVWLDDDHKRLLAFLFENGMYILNKVKPKYFRMHVAFGTGDPYSTGRIISWVAIITGIFGIGGIELEPDYDNKKLDIDTDIEGNFFLIPVLIKGFKIYNNKDFKRFILKKNV